MDPAIWLHYEIMKYYGDNYFKNINYLKLNYKYYLIWINLLLIKSKLPMFLLSKKK